MTAVAAPPTAADVQLIPLGQLRESSHNPRQHFDPGALEDLAASLKAVGQLTPCVVRPLPGKVYELAAGHRRFRAAQVAGLTHLLCVVRELDDAQFLEVLTIENLQRDDLHPLEEAEGFRALMLHDKKRYDAAKIADRVGRSVAYVYDRLKLLQLTKEAQQLFYAGAFEAGHAVILARLTPEQQARAIASDRSGNGQIGGLFVDERAGTIFDEERFEDEPPRKPVSVREFQQWVNDHCRFDVTAVDAQLFPETAQVLKAATAAAQKIVPITYDFHVPDEAKAEGERTYGPQSWKRADGQEWFNGVAHKTEKSKPCEHAVMGVIVVGDGRSEAFPVCVAKQKCTVHWPKPKASPAAGGKKDTQQERWEEQARKAEEREEQARQERAARNARYEKAWDAICKAVLAGVGKLPNAKKIPLLLKATHCRGGAASIDHAVTRIIGEDLLELGQNDWRREEFEKGCKKLLGVDVKKILDKVAPEPVGEKPAAAKKTKK